MMKTLLHPIFLRCLCQRLLGLFALLFPALTAAGQEVQEIPFDTIKAKLVGHWRCVLEEIQCTNGRKPDLSASPFHLQQFHFRGDGTYSQSYHGALGLSRTESGTWWLEARGSADRKWHLLHLAPEKVWIDGGPASPSKERSATKFFMTTASTDAFSAIIDKVDPGADCCAGPQSHMMLSYFRMKPFAEDSPSTDRSFRNVPELKQSLTKAMTLSGPNRWLKWLDNFPLELPNKITGMPKCWSEWKAFAAVYDSPDVDEISAMEVPSVHAASYLAAIKESTDDDEFAQLAQAFKRAQAKGKNLGATNFPTARFWGVIAILAGGEILYVPVGITPNSRYIALAVWP